MNIVISPSTQMLEFHSDPIALLLRLVFVFNDNQADTIHTYNYNHICTLGWLAQHVYTAIGALKSLKEDKLFWLEIKINLLQCPDFPTTIEHGPNITEPTVDFSGLCSATIIFWPCRMAQNLPLFIPHSCEKWFYAISFKMPERSEARFQSMANPGGPKCTWITRIKYYFKSTAKIT